MIRPPKIKVRPIDYETGEMPSFALDHNNRYGFELAYPNTDDNGNGNGQPSRLQRHRLLPGRPTAFATVGRPLSSRTMAEIRAFKIAIEPFSHRLSRSQFARIRAVLRS